MSKILCAIYLLIAVSTVHSASYYYRAGREVIVPAVEEIKEVVAELKKDEPVVVKEVDAVPVINVAEIEKAIESIDESRAVQHPVLRLDALEVIQPGKTDKVVTVAETVKNAAVQAIEKQNQEVAESVKAAEVPVVEPKVVPVVEPVVPIVPIVPVVEVAKVDDVPAVKSAPIIEPVEIKSQVVESPEPVVPVVKDEIKVESVVPAVEAVKELNEVKPVVEVKEEVRPVVESVRSADPEAAKPEEPIKPEVVEVPQPAVVEESQPQVRQAPQAPPAPVAPQQPNPIQAAITTITQGFSSLLQNAGGLNPFAQRPQSDTEALNTNEVAATPGITSATQGASPTTSAPNLLQQAITQISNQVNNLIPFRQTTIAPAIVPPVVSGTRGSDEEVEVVQNIDVDVNDKVDLSKNAQ